MLQTPQRFLDRRSPSDRRRGAGGLVTRHSVVAFLATEALYRRQTPSFPLSSRYMVLPFIRLPLSQRVYSDQKALTKALTKASLAVSVSLGTRLACARIKFYRRDKDGDCGSELRNPR